MYKLLSSKISPRYVLRELHLAKKRGRDSGHADFFHPQLPYLSPPSPLFSHRSILLLSPTSLTDPSLLLFHFLLRSSSFHPFLSPLPLLLCRSKSSFLSPPPPTLFHLSTVYFFFSLLLPSLPFLSVFIFGFFHNFAPMRYVLTGQWVSGEHLPPVSSSILYHPNAGWHRICHGAWTR